MIFAAFAAFDRPHGSSWQVVKVGLVQKNMDILVSCNLAPQKNGMDKSNNPIFWGWFSSFQPVCFNSNQWLGVYPMPSSHWSGFDQTITETTKKPIRKHWFYQESNGFCFRSPIIFTQTHTHLKPNRFIFEDCDSQVLSPYPISSGSFASPARYRLR